MKETLPTWAKLELDLMEDNKPAMLQSLLEKGTLEEHLMKTENRMEDSKSYLLREDYDEMEADEILRQELLEMYLPDLYR